MQSRKLTSSLSTTARVIEKNSPVVKHSYYSRQGTVSCRSQSTKTKSPRQIHVSLGIPKNIFRTESNQVAPSSRDLNSVKKLFYQSFYPILVDLLN